MSHHLYLHNIRHIKVEPHLEHTVNQIYRHSWLVSIIYISVPTSGFGNKWIFTSYLTWSVSNPVSVPPHPSDSPPTRPPMSMKFRTGWTHKSLNRFGSHWLWVSWGASSTELHTAGSITLQKKIEKKAQRDQTGAWEGTELRALRTVSR